MTEPVVTPEPVVAPTAEPAAAPVVEPAPEPTPQSFIDGEGNFKEGWEGAYLTEDQRGNARVANGRVTSVKGLLDTVINSDKMISGDKILRPSDNFGDADWDAYHAAGGWTNQPIDIPAPEGLPEGIWSDDRAKTFSEGFNKLRLNPKQVAGIIEMYNADLVQQITDQGNVAETSMAELKAGLLTDWGNSYAQKEHNANFAVEKGTKGDAEFKARVLQKFGNDPDFIRYNANLGEGFSESGSISVTKQDPTPNDIQSKINEIMNSEAFIKPMHPNHKETMATLRRLHDEKVKVRTPA